MQSNFNCWTFWYFYYWNWKVWKGEKRQTFPKIFFVTKMKNRKIDAAAKIRFVTNLFCHKSLLSQKSSLNLRIKYTHSKYKLCMVNFDYTLRYDWSIWQQIRSSSNENENSRIGKVPGFRDFPGCLRRASMAIYVVQNELVKQELIRKTNYINDGAEVTSENAKSSKI